MSEEIEIPDQVKDSDSYLEYLKLSQLKSIKLPDRLIDTSDVHTTVDPLWVQSMIDDKVKHLPFQEKDSILKKVKVARAIQNNMLIARAKAYGKQIIKSDSAAVSKEQMKVILDERSTEILEYYGRYLDSKVVLKIIHLEWGYNISISSLENVRKNNLKKITSLQESFREDINSAKLSHKRFRLEEIWQLFKDRKTIYNQSKNREDVKLMLALLKEARSETEAHQIHIKGEFSHKIESVVSEHVEREIMGNLTIQDIILARVAHRAKVNPAFIINRLHNSVYAKFTGFGNSNDSLMEEDIIYPSSMVYNWDAIAKAQSQDPVDIEFEEIVDQKEKDSLSDIRSQLKKKLKQKTTQAENIQGKVDRNAE